MKYTYHGPQSGATLKDGKEALEVLFFNGRGYELPESHPYVKSLVAQKYLKPVEQTKPKFKKSKETKEEVTNAG